MRVRAEVLGLHFQLWKVVWARSGALPHGAAARACTCTNPNPNPNPDPNPHPNPNPNASPNPNQAAARACPGAIGVHPRTGFACGMPGLIRHAERLAWREPGRDPTPESKRGRGTQ